MCSSGIEVASETAKGSRVIGLQGRHICSLALVDFVYRIAGRVRAYVDNLKARLFEELRRLVPKPSFRDSFCGPCRLIDMHAVEGTHGTTVTFAVFWTGSDDMGQYVYAGWFWAVMFSVSSIQHHVRNNENLLFLVACQCIGQYLFHLFIITCRDLIQFFRCFVAALKLRKVLFELRLVLDELEALALERILVFISGDISNCHR